MMMMVLVITIIAPAVVVVATGMKCWVSYFEMTLQLTRYCCVGYRKMEISIIFIDFHRQPLLLKMTLSLILATATWNILITVMLSVLPMSKTKKILKRSRNRNHYLVTTTRHPSLLLPVIVLLHDRHRHQEKIETDNNSKW